MAENFNQPLYLYVSQVVLPKWCHEFQKKSSQGTDRIKGSSFLSFNANEEYFISKVPKCHLPIIYVPIYVLPCLETIQLVTTETTIGIFVPAKSHFCSPGKAFCCMSVVVWESVRSSLNACFPHSQQQQLQQGKNFSSPAKCSAFPSAPHDFVRWLMIPRHNSAGTSTVQDSARPSCSITLYICCSFE